MELVENNIEDAVCATINNIIIKQQLKKGDRLPPERYLSKQIKVSRNRIRESLRILQAKGIIVSKRGSGTYVNYVPSNIAEPFKNTDTIKDLLNILSLRTLVETSGFITISQNIDKKILKKIRLTEETIFTGLLNASIDNKPFHSAPVTFEEAIMQYHSNNYLKQIHTYLCSEWKKRLGESVMVAMSAISRHEQHLLILSAIAEKNPDKIRKAVQNHHELTKKSLLYYLKSSNNENEVLK